jgi:hypothetical protein
VSRLHLIVHPETGKLVPADQYVRPRGPRSHLPAPQVIGDVMDPVQSMLDGKLYDSKSRLRRTYREAGMVEVGNDSSVTDPKPFKRPGPDRQAIKAAVGRAFSKAGLGA